MEFVRFLVSVAITMGGLWLSFVVVLMALRPEGMNLREAPKAVPDALRLLRALRGGPELPAGIRRWLRALLVYLACRSISFRTSCRCSVRH